MATNNYLAIKRYIKGISSCIPGMNRYLQKPTGGTNSARYCYSVWLRHLVMAHSSGLATNPKIIAELGPGDSLGVGLAGLITGAEKYYAFDVVNYTNIQNNSKIFNELVSLFKKREAIPGETEFPRIKPLLKSYQFPSAILTDDRLAKALCTDRIERIHTVISNTLNANSIIQYKVPWFDKHIIQSSTVDMVFSQAVLEYVDDLFNTYKAQYSWLKPNGLISHVIDFSSHGTHEEWNGHWTYSDFQWKLIRGNIPWLINRVPCATHDRLLEDTGFLKKCEVKYKTPSGISRKKLARRFRDISDDDLTTSALFIQCLKN
jgi:hypothetical protein